MNKIESLNIKIADRDFEFIERELHARLIKNKIIRYLQNKNTDHADIVHHLQKYGLSVFPYDFRKNYSPNTVTVKHDSDANLFYIPVDDHKIYMRRGYTSAFRAKRYYSNLMMEQDLHSPHRYLTETFQPVENDVIIDIGAAEGFFSLPYIEKAKKIYLFECFDEWQEALRYTYAGYENKVEIIPKMVSDFNDDTHITIDEFINIKNLSNQSVFMKIDAEGSEPLILNGARQYLSQTPPLHLAICTYHAADQESLIRDRFAGWNIEPSDGYMLYYYDYHFEEPYLRHGILRISPDP